MRVTGHERLEYTDRFHRDVNDSRYSTQPPCSVVKAATKRVIPVATVFFQGRRRPRRRRPGSSSTLASRPTPSTPPSPPPRHRLEILQNFAFPHHFCATDSRVRNCFASSARLLSTASARGIHPRSRSARGGSAASASHRSARAASPGPPNRL